MTLPTDDAPTEAIPVVPRVGQDRYDVDHSDDIDHRDDLVDEEWTEPRRRSRVTVALVVALLVALGFLAGVVVGRGASTSSAPERTGGAVATSTARPNAGGPFGRPG